MNTTQVAPVHQGTTLRVGEWLLAIFGGIAAFLGLFVLLGSEDQSIGLGGDYSWTVGELGNGWGYGLLAGGIVGVVAAGLLLRYDVHEGYRHEYSPEGTFVAHAIAFALVNAFLWAQDIALGDGLNYAYWVTIVWGVGLLLHAYTAFAGRSHSPPTG
jgi:hypothetical protein